jgi:hypothetical protein
MIQSNVDEKNVIKSLKLAAIEYKKVKEYNLLNSRTP